MKPFRISVPTRDLDDLRERLARTRFAPALSPDWTHGTPPGYLAELVEHWRTKFDWSAAEAKLNEMAQFTATVRDAELHFVHVEGTGPKPLPLLFSHGWPGSFWDVSKIIGPLTDPAAHGGDPADAFHVVAPSLQSYLTRLRNALPGLAIVRRSGGYVLLVHDPLTVDVHLVERARAASAPERAVELFEQALQLWRGEALAGLDSPWAVATRELLDRQLFAAELDVTDLRLQLGRHGVLVPELVERAATHPLRRAGGRSADARPVPERAAGRGA